MTGGDHTSPEQAITQASRVNREAVITGASVAATIFLLLLFVCHSCYAYCSWYIKKEKVCGKVHVSEIICHVNNCVLVIKFFVAAVITTI
jgi:hypothetical protein